MKIYFDESEDFNRNALLVSAIFVYGDSKINELRDGINEIKKLNNFQQPDGQNKEIKYNKIASDLDLKVSKECIDLFFQSKNTYFRSCIVFWNKNDLRRFGRRDQNEKLKKAILYTNLTKKLIKLGVGGFKNCILLYDELVRCKGDHFQQIIENNFGYSSLRASTDFPVIKSVASLKSNDDFNSIVQLTDLLMGCVLNQNFPSSINKNKIREYLISKLSVRDLKKETWDRIYEPAEPQNRKFYIHYLNIDAITVNHKTRKNRSR